MRPRWLGLACAAALAGCGGAAHPPGPASDRATAEAINLGPGDLPGFLAGAPHDATLGPGAAKLARCAGLPSSGQAGLVTVTSPTFTAAVGQAQQQFSSEVTMVRTAAEAEGDIAALGRPAVMGCLRSELGAQLQGVLPPGATLGPVTVSRFRPSGTTLPAVGLRLELPVTATTSGASAEVNVTADLVEFGAGRAVVGLYARTTGTTSLTGEESRLTGLLAARAERAGRPHR